MTQKRTTGTAVGLIVGILLIMMGGCGSESSQTGGTGQVILEPLAGVFAAAALPEQKATLDIVGTSVIKRPMNVDPATGSVSLTVSDVPVGTWTFRITYSAKYTDDPSVPNDPVVVAKATGVGTVTANTTTVVSLPWANTNFFDDTDAATNLEEVNAHTDPRNPDAWPVLRVALSAGGLHSLALKDGGRIWAWGSDGAGQLGNGDPLVDRPTPVEVTSGGPFPFMNMYAVSAGGSHSLALKGDGDDPSLKGTVWAWGSNSFGQLGKPGALAKQPTPVQVVELTEVGAVSAGGLHSLALKKSDGTVWAWGSDAAGQLGNDALLVDQPTPVQVAGLTGVRALSAGNFHSLALKGDGTVWAWGTDAAGQLGNDALLANQPTPVQVKGAGGSGFLTDVVAVSAGHTHSLALKGDGTVWAWGSDAAGQLGNDALLANQPTPVQVAALTDVRALSAGNSFSLALKGDGTVWAWGGGGSGQLGNIDALDKQPTPVQVVEGASGSGFLTNVVAVSAGGSHSLALKRNGTVWAWGSEVFGQLGDNIMGDFDQPTPVKVIGIR